MRGRSPSVCWIVFSLVHSGGHSAVPDLGHGAGPGGDDVVDPEDHDGGVGGGVDGLLTDPVGLDDVQGLHVLDLSAVGVETGVDLALLVLLPHLDDDVDRVETGVLGEGAGDGLHGGGEGLDGDLLPSTDGDVHR